MKVGVQLFFKMHLRGK